ncbi:histidine kinase dimerization/phosphoacceptor domain -containing protein [Paraflavitalea pollutisoli]|uniref:histidine kinase dimerization/phosphoacceptor domain -containing protein n=1 Tax=Paraflavitalea pollutisoli TaxID=3034143 RepID=UPI0023EC2075|nr:histidine kinase dimerization/phosphoacceptor domain -containing protein [Paraflavitalea sp. H1-2-19X]
MKKFMLLVVFILFGRCGWSQIRLEKARLKEQIAHSKEDTAKVNLLIKLAIYYVYNHIENNNLDSLNLFLRQARQLSIKLGEKDLEYKALGKLAYAASLADDPDSSKRAYLQVIDYYQKTGQTAKEAESWFDLAERYHMFDSKYMDETIGYFQKARALYLKSNLPIDAADALASIAGRHADYKNIDLADKEFQQALAEYKAAGYKQLRFIYQDLLEFEKEKGNYYRALAYCLEAIKYIDISKDSISAANYYRQAAECNAAVKKYEQAIEWLGKASAAFKSDSFSIQLVVAQNLLALNRTEEAWLILNILAKSPDFSTERFMLNWTLAVYYHKIDNHELALRYYLKARGKVDDDWEDNLEGNNWLIQCNNAIAEVYLGMEQPLAAKKYLDETALLLKRTKTSLDPALMAAYYGLQYKYNVATGNYPAAVQHLERQVLLNDSLFTADKDKQLAELNIQYETVQKEQAIKDLQSQRAAQQAETAKASMQRNITIGGILVMVIVSVLIYRNYQHKKAANDVIAAKNNELQRLVSEKEWLLKEVHHRVKNNLHTVVCLLESQAMNLQDDALEANQISKHRIYTMSMIHQQLYRTDDVKTIDMAVFLPELLRYLNESFGTERRIRIHRTIAPIKLGVSQAIPIALIVNEAITNAIKYAFPGDSNGEIHVSLKQTDKMITLVIVDDGIGVPPAILEEETASMGMRLLKGLTRDLSGHITIANESGTAIRVSFELDLLGEQAPLAYHN